MTYPFVRRCGAVVILIIVMAKVIPTLADVFTDLAVRAADDADADCDFHFSRNGVADAGGAGVLKIGCQVYGNTPQGRIEKAESCYPFHL